ncbi:MAG TPA: hypothetical protein VHC23_11815, partial [Jatrophihabitans sp.]|nr:hypothetical protein [Jatrophihabitans sp.]
MTAALIELETEDFADAARALAVGAGDELGRAVRGLWDVLGDCAGMAGGDPGGTSWAAGAAEVDA